MYELIYKKKCMHNTGKIILKDINNYCYTNYHFTF